MTTSLLRIITTAGVLLASLPSLRAANPDGMLPNERTADQILNGDYPFPPSPKVETHDDFAGFAQDRLSPVPAPGVHPRILLSPSDLPGLRERLKNTDTGRALYATLKARADDALRNPKNWGGELYDKLAAADLDGAKALLNARKGFPPGVGHYQPYLYAIVMEAFDALISEDAVKGRKTAAALATYARLLQPGVTRTLSSPLGDDLWRARASDASADWSINASARDAVGYHLLGYGYDFAYNFMTGGERDAVRGLIATATAGKVWMGAELPHHFRNWNWCAVGLGQPLLALAIEGEPGYDARVYKLGVDILRDYLTYGIDAHGCSTEAVGYTQFGLVWATPFAVAAARRGDNLLVQNHHRAMVDWYIHTMEPFGKAWVSHGDGGDAGPAIWTVLMWKYFYPADPKADYVWQNLLTSGGAKMLQGNFHIIEPLIYSSDPLKDTQGKSIDYAAGAKLSAPLTWFDPVRSSLITRSAWTPEALTAQFECRTDSVGSSHEHADRGNFTLSALGRSWAKDNFRSVESRHHNLVLIDGQGQGFWPGPGKWLGLAEQGDVVLAACDAQDAYNWMWPKQVTTEDPDTFIRYKYLRWASYIPLAKIFRTETPGFVPVRDPRPSVVTHWTGFTAGDPRMWDEDSWPVRLPHNPVQRAYRSIAVVKGAHPYMVVVDDIQKDNQERLYEWLMQTGLNTEVASLSTNDVILCDATARRDETGAIKPVKGDRQLLMRVLDMKDPAKPGDYQTRPSFRLETFERKDTLAPEMSKSFLSGSRSFGLDKRFVIASRSVAPDFKILLFPHRVGESLPITTWNDAGTLLTIDLGGLKDTIAFTLGADGRTRLKLTRAGQPAVELN